MSLEITCTYSQKLIMPCDEFETENFNFIFEISINLKNSSLLIGKR